MKTTISRNNTLAVKQAGEGTVELLRSPTFKQPADWTQAGTLYTIVNGVAVAAAAQYGVDHLDQTVNGLVIGATYRFKLGIGLISAALARLEVVGHVSVDLGVPGEISFLFVATSTGHIFRVTGTTGFTGRIIYASMRLA